MAIDYTSIDELINDFQLMIDDTSYDKDAQIYQLRLLALQGLRELKFDAEQEVKTTSLTVDSSTLKATLPTDYVKAVRIGLIGSDGNIHPLGVNPNLTLDASAESSVNDGGLQNEPYVHASLGRRFGTGGGNNVNGYYRINRNDNTINFSSDLSGKSIYVEYISDGIGSTQPVNHVIRIEFKDGDNVDPDTSGINTDTELHIPYGGEFNYITFYFNTGETDQSNMIKISLDDTKEEIAASFTKTFNEGYPGSDAHGGLSYTEYLVSGYGNDKAIKAKASNNGSFVDIVYSDLELLPLSLSDDSMVAANTSALESQELIQQGVIGTGPRVHKFCEEALRSYIYYKYIQRKRGVPANEKQMAKRAYYNEKRLARARMMSFNKAEALQTGRKGFKQSPKF